MNGVVSDGRRWFNLSTCMVNSSAGKVTRHSLHSASPLAYLIRGVPPLGGRPPLFRPRDRGNVCVPSPRRLEAHATFPP